MPSTQVIENVGTPLMAQLKVPPLWLFPHPSNTMPRNIEHSIPDFGGCLRLNR
jgi:hypothetical protein